METADGGADINGDGYAGIFGDAAAGEDDDTDSYSDTDLDGDVGADSDGDGGIDSVSVLDNESDGDGIPLDHPPVAWVLVCQNDDGEFGAFPGDISALSLTAAAIELLDLFEISIPRVEEAAEFIRPQQNEDGGFRIDRPAYLSDTATCEQTYYALAILEVLGKEVPNCSGLFRFLNAMQTNEYRGNGSFIRELILIGIGETDGPASTALIEAYPDGSY